MLWDDAALGPDSQPGNYVRHGTLREIGKAVVNALQACAIVRRQVCVFCFCVGSIYRG